MCACVCLCECGDYKWSRGVLCAVSVVKRKWQDEELPVAIHATLSASLASFCLQYGDTDRPHIDGRVVDITVQ